MTKALIMFILIVGLIAGLIFTLKRTANLGTPPPDVLDRAKRRARELDAEEKERGG